MGIDTLHREACARGDLSYTDPGSGYRVFTALAHEARGRCCGCGCRHCPFGHLEVDQDKRAHLQRDPWIEGTVPTEHVDLLFWSGGKDSYLAMRALEREAQNSIMLITTFDGRTEKVAHQEVRLEDVRRQRKALGCAQVLVPLFPDNDYLERVRLAVQTVQRHTKIARLVFGDLHLQQVRTWREEVLGASPELSHIPIHLPLWGWSHEALLDELESAPARTVVSAVTDEECAKVVSVGDLFGRELVARLPDGVDPFGENGEFHSYVEMPTPTH